MRSLNFSITLLALLVPLLSAVSTYADSVDDFVRAEMSKRHVPGLSLVVIKDNEIVKSGTYGLANVELNVPVREKTSFEIASMTKQLTDAAILLLAEEGKIHLDDSITKYINGLPSEWLDITIRRLMLHTAGIRDDWDENDNFFLTKNSNDEFLRALTPLPLLFKPGEHFSYGCGPFLLGMVIEKVSGTSYSRFMQERIFAPLGMHDTAVNDVFEIVNGRASGYVFRDGVLRNGARISATAESRGDVGVRSTALDLAKWLNAIDAHQLLKQSSWNLMFTPGKLNDGTSIPVGFGWFLFPIQGDVWKHGGAFRTGFNSSIERYVDDKLAIIILTNLRSGSIASKIGTGIAGLYDPIYKSRAELPPVPDTDPARSKRLKSLLVSLSTGHPDMDQFAEGFPFDLYLKKDWEDAGVGKMKSFDFVKCTQISRVPINFFSVTPKEVCTYKIVGSEDNYMSFVLSSNGKVTYIEPFE